MKLSHLRAAVGIGLLTELQHKAAVPSQARVVQGKLGEQLGVVRYRLAVPLDLIEPCEDSNEMRTS